MEVPHNLQKSLDNVIKKEGYTSHSVDIRQIGGDGASFLSKAYTVNVKGKTKDGDKETFIFVKGIISIEKMDAILDLPKAYASEAFVYNELSQVFNELQEDAGIPPQDRFKIINSYGESNSNAIILENVAVKGYKTCHRTYIMSLEVAEMALKELAKFHALSFIVKAKRPEYYRKKIHGYSHPFIFGEEWERSALNIAKLATRYLNDDTKGKVEKFLENYTSKWRDYDLDQTSTKCCLCHGDFRLNNLLTKYDGNKLEDLYIVDYQLMSFVCPINDFLFFIFTGTDQQFRKQHLLHLKDFYYNSFSEFLKNFNLESEDIYPKKEFDRDYKKRLDYGLIVAMYFMPFFLADEETIPDVGEQTIAEMDFGVHEDFPERMQGIVDDYVKWGYL